MVVTSAKNNCLYCVVAHSAVHRILSKNPYLADQVSYYSSSLLPFLEFFLGYSKAPMATDEQRLNP